MQRIDQMFNSAEAKAAAKKAEQETKERIRQLYSDLIASGYSEQDALSIVFRAVNVTKCFGEGV